MVGPAARPASAVAVRRQRSDRGRRRAATGAHRSALWARYAALLLLLLLLLGRRAVVVSWGWPTAAAAEVPVVHAVLLLLLLLLLRWGREAVAVLEAMEGGRITPRRPAQRVAAV